MSLFKAARQELKVASSAIGRMKGAEGFDDFDSEWRLYLNAIEKVFVKVERAAQPYRNKFEPWQGKYNKLRKKDSLLKYLKQARHADNHSIQDVAKVTPGVYSFSVPGGPGVTHIQSLKTDHTGRVVEYIGNRPAQIVDIPSRLQCVGFQNNGTNFNPPKEHLGKKLKSDNPVYLSEQGLAFYESFLVEAERKFDK
ncbi:hypothetical protein [Photobacterium leiognathi]|uniref:hypothetical protein n=1 Tax=Photobacterium leiognathi TaxID=553611 RepID=UPI002732940F|nr:hypothetical protein [Photobacterium leiognathi]